MNVIRTTRRTRRYACAAILLLAACSGGSTTAPDTNTKDPNQVGVDGGTVQSSDQRVTLDIPAGAVSRDITISVTPISNPTSDTHVANGSVYQFGPDGTQFAEPVTLTLAYDDTALAAGTDKSGLRISHYVGGGWQEVDNITVDSVAHTVSGQIHSFSSYAVTADPCKAMSLQLGGTNSGTISNSSCLYPEGPKYSDYYDFTVTEAGAYTANVTSSSSPALTGKFGIKDYGDDPTQGTVWAYSDIGTPLHVALEPGTYQVFVSGADTTVTGSYSLTSSTSPLIGNPPCNPEFVGLQPGTFNEATLTPESCDITLQYANPAKYNGEHAKADYYVVKLDAGKTYTFTATILTQDTNIALTLYASGQTPMVTAGGPDLNPKVATFTPQSSMWVYVEVSSSTITDEWYAPLGSYRIAVSG